MPTTSQENQNNDTRKVYSPDLLMYRVKTFEFFVEDPVTGFNFNKEKNLYGNIINSVNPECQSKFLGNLSIATYY